MGLSGLGKYNRMPPYAHYAAYYRIGFGTPLLKKAFVQALMGINGVRDRIYTSISGLKGEVACERFFCIYVACGDKFRCLSSRLIKTVLNYLSTGADYLDFKVEVKYRYSSSSRRGHAWSDRFLVRTVFGIEVLRLLMIHVGGVYRTCFEDLEDLIYSELVKTIRNMGFKPSIERIGGVPS